MNYRAHEMNIIYFEENSDILTDLSGDGTPGSSVWSVNPGTTDK